MTHGELSYSDLQRLKQISAGRRKGRHDLYRMLFLLAAETIALGLVWAVAVGRV